MSIRNLSYLFKPRSVALLGATDRARSVGALVMRNLLRGGFRGPIMPVDPKHKAVSGVLAYPDLKSLPVVPDLAIICTPLDTLPQLISELGERGTRAAIAITAGSSNVNYEDRKPFAQTMLEAARPHLFRILGLNSLGLIVPSIGLNASFFHQPASSGRIAFVSQSGALCTTVLDWARPKNIGFSHFISLGASDDINCADVLDYLGSDPAARSLLIYIDAIKEPRKFMSAARAAARNKPVMIIKSGRVTAGAEATASLTGALVGTDDIYDSAFRRAGILRVYSIDELFAAVETLARSQPARQAARLAIVTNSGDIGVMALDNLIEGGGRLATLSEQTITALNKVLPHTWASTNPIDIGDEASSQRYVETLKLLFKAREVDNVLCMHAPVAISSAAEVAKAVVKTTRQYKHNLLTCWMGSESATPARSLFHDAGLPTYDTPEQSIQAFLHMIRYRRNQELLMQTPPEAPTDFSPDTEKARSVVEKVIASDRRHMSQAEANAVLAAYGIPTLETHIASGPVEAGHMAEKMGGRIALKVLSPDLSHIPDVGSVVLDLKSSDEVENAVNDLLSRIGKTHPNAQIDGFRLQRMARRPGAQELSIAMTSDPIFGPVILFGEGGTAAEVIGDRSVALPPLNMTLARDMIARTRVYKLLRGYGNRPGVDLDAICLTLMQVSQLIIDISEIVELDINSLSADAKGVLVQDVRIRIAPSKFSGTERLAIRPYPKKLEQRITLNDGQEMLLRPIRPEDQPAHQIFFSHLSSQDIRLRFFNLINELPHTEMARLTQIDYDREMAFIATKPNEHNHAETYGVVRTITDPDNEETEFAVIVRSDKKGLGIGRVLMNKMIDYCRSRGTKRMLGQVLRENTSMLRLVDRLGFSRKYNVEERHWDLTLDLQGD